MPEVCCWGLSAFSPFMAKRSDTSYSKSVWKSEQELPS